MKLRAEKIRSLAEQGGVSVEALAQAVSREGLEGDAAVSAVKNWLSGRDHPRCRKGDIEKLAAAVRVSPKDICRFVSEVRWHRGSPSKAKPLIDLVRGKTVDKALNMLSFTPKRAALDIKKALNAAIADAEQAEADVTQLVVSESRVDDGPRMKRFRAKDRGRAHNILKRYAHITIGVQEK